MRKESKDGGGRERKKRSKERTGEGNKRRRSKAYSADVALSFPNLSDKLGISSNRHHIHLSSFSPSTVRSLRSLQLLLSAATSMVIRALSTMVPLPPSSSSSA